MLRKIFCWAAALILLIIPVSAAGKISIDAGDEFTVYGEDSGKAAEILGMSETELDGYVSQNNIVYLAVNEDNTKQIRLTVAATAFSESTGNLSLLSDSEIEELIPDITGDSAVKGEIIENGGQKFVLSRVSSEDSGGGYTLERYFTVAGDNEYILSFYTSDGVSEDYIGEVFESFKSDDFYGEKDKSPYSYIVIAALVLFSAGALFIIYTIIRDLTVKRRHGASESAPDDFDDFLNPPEDE